MRKGVISAILDFKSFLLSITAKHYQKSVFNKSSGLILLFLLLFVSCRQKPLPNQAMIDLLKIAEKNDFNRQNVFSPEATMKYCNSLLNNVPDNETRTKALSSKADALMKLGQESKAIDILLDLLKNVWDYDNDGWPDILVCGYEFSQSFSYYAAAEVIQMPVGNAAKSFLFRNNHDGTFYLILYFVELPRLTSVSLFLS